MGAGDQAFSAGRHREDPLGRRAVFKVSGKMFCVVPLEPDGSAVSFRVEGEEFAELIERPGIVPAPYLARARWTALENGDATPPAELKRRTGRWRELAAARLHKRGRLRLSALRQPVPPATE